MELNRLKFLNNDPEQTPQTKQTAKSARGDQTEAALLTANAQVLFDNQEYILSFALIRSALNINSRYPQALVILSRILMERKDWAQALAPLTELLRQGESFETAARIGICYYQTQNDEKALQHFDRAVAMSTESSELLFDILKMMGNIQCRLKDYPAAEESYHRAFAIHPKSDALLVNLGTLEIQRGDLESALIRFRSAVGLNAKNSNAWVGLALVHNEYGDFELAKANVRTAVEISAGNRTAVHLLTAWAAKDQDIASAIPHLANYVMECESDEEMSSLLIQFFVTSGQIQTAKIETERLLLWNPESVLGQKWERHLSGLESI